MTALSTFEESVKAKLMGMVADLIPEERFTSIVQATVSEFEKKVLPELIKAELTNKYRELILDELGKPDWRSQYANGRQKLGPAVSELLINAAPMVLESMFSSAMQTVLFQFENALRNRY